MFIFRWLKKIIFLAVFIAAAFIIANYNWQGKPIKQHVREFFRSTLFKDGVKDIRLFVSEIVSSVNSEVKENIKEEDKKQLEGVINKELEKGNKNGKRK